MHPKLLPLVLASASPRRQYLLSLLHVPFRTLVPDVDESFVGEDVPGEAARVALRKARAVAGSLPRGTVVAADTVVEVAGRVLGKPVDPGDAARMLGLLSGSTHRVHTGVAVVHVPGGQSRSATATTEVRMRVLTPREIEEYVASGEPMGKAGAYAVQETGDRFVEELRGAYDTVVGLPLETVRRLLEELAAALPDAAPPAPDRRGRPTNR